jgi:hypothetical protein
VIFLHFNVFVAGILLCVRHFIMCQPLYVVPAILCSYSHFMLSQSFTCCVLAIFLCVSHSMIWQPFLCCGNHFRLSQSFLSFVSVILCPSSYFMLSQSFTSCVSAILFYVSYFMCVSHSIFLSKSLYKGSFTILSRF